MTPHLQRRDLSGKDLLISANKIRINFYDKELFKNSLEKFVSS